MFVQVYLTHNNVSDDGALAIAEVVEEGNGVSPVHLLHEWFT